MARQLLAGSTPVVPAAPQPTVATDTDRSLQERRLFSSTQAPRPDRPKPKTTLLDMLDRDFAPDETIKPKHAAALAESVGLPGRTYMQIARGESGLRPAAKGHDPGGTVGLGLLQMTKGVQSPETVAKWDRIASRHEGGYRNPVANVKMAKVLAGEGTGVSNYYGTGFVSDPNAHIPGGRQRANRILGRPVQGSGGKGRGRKPLSIAELFHDPPGAVNLKHGEPTSAIGGHGGHVHAASEKPRHVQRMAGIAQRMGLDVGQHPDFGGGHETGHAPEGYHPRGLAIDVTGDPQTLMRYNQRLARRGGAPSAPGMGPASVGGSTGVLQPSLGGGGAAPHVGGGARGLAEILGVGGGGGGGAGRRGPSQHPLSPERPMPRTRFRQGQEDEEEQETDLISLLLGR